MPRNASAATHFLPACTNRRGGELRALGLPIDSPLVQSCQPVCIKAYSSARHPSTTNRPSQFTLDSRPCLGVERGDGRFVPAIDLHVDRLRSEVGEQEMSLGVTSHSERGNASPRPYLDTAGAPRRGQRLQHEVSGNEGLAR